MFITFEGIEGSGKSTQLQLFCTWLEEKGYNVVYFREPGGTKIGEEIRNLLLSKEFKEMKVETELFLFLSARAQLVKEKILPALREGKIVVCDRYYDATIAYQCYGGGIDEKEVEISNKIATEGLFPDLTFILDLDIKEGLKRAGLKDRIEEKGKEFHERVRKGYLALAEKFKERIFLIPTNLEVNKTQEKIRSIFLEKFPSY
jgi:dTMP kinase